MDINLKDIIIKEYEALKGLLKMLDEQYRCILNNDVFGLEACVSKIEKCNRTIADWEIKRRDITKGKEMSKLVAELHDKDLENSLRNVKMLIQETKLQKDTNELLLKQQLVFTSKVLNILNPDRSAKVYNSYGKLKR